MSIRLKFLLVLLGFSLVPLALVSYVNLRSLHEQGATFSETATRELNNLVREELRITVDDNARTLRLGERSIWLGLELLADAARDSLASGENFSRTPLFPKDFNRSHNSGSQLELSPLPQIQALAQGKDDDTEGSPDHAVVIPPPGEENLTSEQQREASMLASLQPEQERISKVMGEYGHRQFVCLTDGLCGIYPGHKGFAPGYSPTQSVWFKRTMQEGVPDWHGPLPDPVFGTPTYVAAMPILGDDGEILGVTAMDTPLQTLLQRQRLVGKWNEMASTYLVNLQTNPETGEKGLMVYAKRDYEDVVRAFAENDDFDWLFSNDPDSLSTLLKALAGQDSGVLPLSKDGQLGMWAFALYGSDLQDSPIYMLLTVPQSAYMALPRAFESQALAQTRSQAAIAIGAFLLAGGLVVLVALVGARSQTRPLLEISSAAERLSKGDFSVHLDMHFKDERDKVVRVLNEMGPRLSRYVEVSQALAIAHEVQKNLLPSEAPEVEGYDISGASLYCDETGGDYFDFIACSPGSQGCYTAVVGDVSGHGVSSALLMATARALLHGLMVLPMRLDERVTLVNRLLSEDLIGSGRFMTLFILELAPNESPPCVYFVRAGHDPALLYSPGSDSFSEFGLGSVPLGVLEDCVYEQHMHEFSEPGSVLVLGTDGIWEASSGAAKNSRGEGRKMFGKQRLRDVVRANAHKPARGIQQAVLDAVLKFQMGRKQQDDITITVIKKS